MVKSAISPDKFLTFGDLLKYLRKREELTQREFAIMVGYSDTQISRLEQNQRVPDTATLQALFVPALHIEREPQWVERLLELAQQARLGEFPETEKDIHAKQPASFPYNIRWTRKRTGRDPSPVRGGGGVGSGMHGGTAGAVVLWWVSPNP